MRRLLVLLPLLFSLFFTACPLDGGGSDGETSGSNGNNSNNNNDNGNNNNNGGDENTRVVFDNTAGSCPVIVYESNERTENVKIAEIAAGASSAVIPWRTNSSYTFYLAYPVFIEDIPVTYIPRPGPDQIVCRIDPDLINTVKLPPIAAALDSEDTPLSGAAYIVIQNDSYSSCYLLRGSQIITPDNVPDSHIVNSSEKALYRFSTPGTVSEYKLFVNGKNIGFSGVDGDFEGGRIYTFVFSGAGAEEADLSLKSNTAIILANTFMGQGLNKEYSFTTWRDKKTDAETGETVTGNNAVIFYADSAKLTGSYWQHPQGDFDYNGQILESYFSETNDGIVIWTLKSKNTGYLLKMQEDQTLQVSTAKTPHPFYKQ